MRAVIQERRRFARPEAPPRFEISLLEPERPIAAGSLNVSQGGLCLRLEEMLEVRSLVRLQLTLEGSRPGQSARPFECTGRVAWVVQRMDLRTMPPFLFDVGIEFVNPPPLLRHLMDPKGDEVSLQKEAAAHEKPMASWSVRDRCFAPRLERIAQHPLPWHLVVSIDGVPCFSGHYPTERAAVTALTQFKREQAKR